MPSKKQTKIAELRNKFKEYNIDVVDIVKLFDPTKNKVLLPFLMEAVDYQVRQNQLNYEKSSDEPDFMKSLHLNNQNEFSRVILERVYSMIGSEDLNVINTFNKYWDENKVSHNMSQYKSLNDIRKTVYALDLEKASKNADVKTCKIYEDDNWLIIMPLSLLAARLYGAGTKWCTSMRDSSSHYYRYTKNGLLIYILNKKDNIKYAFYKDFIKYIEEGTIMSRFFDETDVQVDSVELDIPYQILDILRIYIKNRQYDRNMDYPEYDQKGLAEYMSKETKNCDQQMTVEGAPEEIRQLRTNITDLIEVPTEPALFETDGDI